MSRTAIERLIAAHAHAADFYRRQLPTAVPALRYLNSRGIIAATAHQPPWTLGYAPRSWTALHDHLRDLGYTDTELLDAGLLTTSRAGGLIDVFRERVIFPIRRATDGAVIAFTGRDVSDWPGAPKYRNTATTPVYRKRDHLHGLAELTNRDTPPGAVFLVEGPADVVALARLGTSTGPCAAVAPCGTALTTQQVTALRDAVPAGTPLVLALDPDYAGRVATERAYPLLRDWPGPLDVVPLPTGTDPAELLARGRDAAEHHLEQHRRPLVDLLIDHRLDRQRLDEVPGQIAALRAAAPLVADAAARDTAHASALCADLADRLHLDPLTILEAVYPQPEEPPPRPTNASRPRAAPIELHRLPDARPTGVEYAYHCLPGSGAAVRVHHSPGTGITAWAFAEGLTDTLDDRVAARLAAEIAARTAIAVGAGAAVEIARTAVNARFAPPGTGQGDATITVLVSPTPAATGRLTIAWAGNVTAYGATARWFAPLTTSHAASPGTVRQGTININYIDRPCGQVVLAGRETAQLPVMALRRMVDGRRPDQAVEELQKAVPLANTVVIRFRTSTSQLAAQAETKTAKLSTTQALPAAPNRSAASNGALRRSEEGGRSQRR